MTSPAQRPKLVISFDDDPPESGAAVASPPPPAAPPRPQTSAPPSSAWPAPTPRGVVDDWAPPAPVSGQDDQILASWGRRAAAVLVDTVIIWTLSLPVIALFFAAAGGSLSGLIAAYLAALAFPALAGLFYYPLMLARTGERNGQTIGKQALGVRVVSVSPSGPDITTGQALLREVVMRQIAIGVIGGLLLFIPPLLDVLWPLWQPRRQSLHDLAAATIVVRDDA
jgi:uncharacterized RDD family membrane protein YckC